GASAGPNARAGGAEGTDVLSVVTARPFSSSFPASPGRSWHLVGRPRARASDGARTLPNWLPGLRRAVPSAPLDELDVQLWSCVAETVANPVVADAPTSGTRDIGERGGGLVRPDVERWLHRRSSTAADWPIDDVLAAKAAG